MHDLTRVCVSVCLKGERAMGDGAPNKAINTRRDVMVSSDEDIATSSRKKGGDGKRVLILNFSKSLQQLIEGIRRDISLK